MYLDYDFLNIDHKNLIPEQGKILISEPTLHDTYFKRSVVLLTEHNDTGTVGFVLNKPIDLPINEVLGDFPEFDAKVYIGGPVGKDTIHFIHTLGEQISESIHIMGNIYWGGDFDKLKELIQDGKVSQDQIRFFLGYSGWGENQLKDELDGNAWLVTELKEEMIMSSDSKIWENVLKQLGEKFQIWVNYPENPAMN